MRRSFGMIVALVAVWMSFGTQDAAAQCFACQNTLPYYQSCIDGDWGTTCTLFYVGTYRYCNTGGEACEQEEEVLGGDDEMPIALVPGDVSPAGTFVANGRRADFVTAGVHRCSGFVVSFQDRPIWAGVPVVTAVLAQSPAEQVGLSESLSL